MTGHRPFGELTKSFTPERLARVAAKAAELRESMTLDELRSACDVSREQMATALARSERAGASAEDVFDMHVSNLRRYVEALGGDLEITARFGDIKVVIDGLGEPKSA